MRLPGDASHRAAERRRAARKGEDAACAHLERAGFVVLARNLRVGRDEIDVLALDPDGATIVIVEVKCRTRAAARPEERIDAAKRHRLSRAALALSTRREFACAPFRFDAVSVVTTPGAPAPHVEHWRGAFDVS